MYKQSTVEPLTTFTIRVPLTRGTYMYMYDKETTSLQKTLSISLSISLKMYFSLPYGANLFSTSEKWTVFLQIMDQMSILYLEDPPFYIY